MFLLGSSTAWAAQREAEFWIFSASLSQAFTDNLLLVRGKGPGEAITNASLRLSYSRLDGSSTLNASGWLGAQRFDRLSGYGGPQFGVNATSELGWGPRARVRLRGSFSDGLNFASLASTQVGLPQIQLQSAWAGTGFTYRLSPDTSFDTQLEASGIRYRADVPLDTSRLLGDAFIPPDLFAPTTLPGPGANEPAAPDEGLLALGLLASEGIRTLRLDFWSWHASAGVSHQFSPRTRLTLGGGYRQTFQSPVVFSEGGQSEAGVALSQVIDPTANLSLSYGFQGSSIRSNVGTHAFTAQVDKQLGTKLRLDFSIGPSYLDGPDRASSGWTLIGGVGLTARFRRSRFSARYSRSRYQAYITGRSEVSDDVHASLGQAIGKRVTLSGYGYYRDARDQLQSQYYYGTAIGGASLGVRIKRRTNAGVSYSLLHYRTQNVPSASRSMISVYVRYSRALK